MGCIPSCQILSTVWEIALLVCRICISKYLLSGLKSHILHILFLTLLQEIIQSHSNLFILKLCSIQRFEVLKLFPVVTVSQLRVIEFIYLELN